MTRNASRCESQSEGERECGSVSRSLRRGTSPPSPSASSLRSRRLSQGSQTKKQNRLNMILIGRHIGSGTEWNELASREPNAKRAVGPLSAFTLADSSASASLAPSRINHHERIHSANKWTCTLHKNLNGKCISFYLLATGMFLMMSHLWGDSLPVVSAASLAAQGARHAGGVMKRDEDHSPSSASSAFVVLEDAGMSNLNLDRIIDSPTPRKSRSNSTVGLATSRQTEMGAGCPKSFAASSSSPDAKEACDCYRFDEGLSIECSDTDWRAVQNILNRTASHAAKEEMEASPIRSLSILQLAANDSHLLPITGAHSLEHLHISDSGLVSVAENAFADLPDLRSLELIGGMLTSVPPAVSKLRKLEKLDLESNRIRAIDAYSFHGLPLLQLSLAANQVVLLKEYSFAGLEDWLEELILSSNKITRFPLSALRKLRKLRILKLAWNEISDLPDDTTRLTSLEALDLSGNAIWHLEEHTFVTMPVLRMLDLSHNRIQSLNAQHFPPTLQRLALSGSQIESIDQQTFKELKQLVALDLSDNPLRKFDFVQYLPGQLAVLSLARVDMSSIHDGQKEFIEQLSTRVERLDVSGARLDRKGPNDVSNETQKCVHMRTQAYTDMLELPLFTQGVIAGTVMCFALMSFVVLVIAGKRWRTRRKQRRPVKPVDQQILPQQNGGGNISRADQDHCQSPSMCQTTQQLLNQYSTIGLSALSHNHHHNAAMMQQQQQQFAQHMQHPHPDEFMPSAFRQYTLAPLPTSPSFATVSDLQVQEMHPVEADMRMTPHEPLPPPPLNTVTLVGWTERTAI